MWQLNASASLCRMRTAAAILVLNTLRSALLAVAIGHSAFASGCTTGHHSFEMSRSFRNQVLAQLVSFRYWNETAACENEVYFLQVQQHERVASLHLLALIEPITVPHQEHACYSYWRQA